jgi:hypothetical protein
MGERRTRKIPQHISEPEAPMNPMSQTRDMQAAITKWQLPDCRSSNRDLKPGEHLPHRWPSALEKRSSRMRHSKINRFLPYSAACVRMRVVSRIECSFILTTQRGMRTSRPRPSPPSPAPQSPVPEERCAVSACAGLHTSVCESPGPRRRSWSALLEISAHCQDPGAALPR